MKTQSIGRAIGAASVAFGILDLAAGPRFGKAIGAGEEMGGLLFRIAGAREVATGVAGLMAPASAAPVHWRLAGDVFDLAALGYIAAPGNPKRKMAFVALGLVAAVALVDLIGSRRIARARRGPR